MSNSVLPPGLDLHVIRGLLVLLALVFSSLVVSAARAESRVVVRPFYGPHADEVRAAVERCLEESSGVVVVSSDEADRAATELGVDAHSVEGRRAVARELELSAWAEGIVQERGAALRVTVVVYDGADHARIVRSVFVGNDPGSLITSIAAAFWDEARTSITAALPPARASSPDPGRREHVQSTATAFPPVEATRSEREVGTSAARPTTLYALLSFGSPFRKLAYNDSLTPSLGDYQLSGARMIDARLGYFPGAHFSKGWTSYLGVDLRGQLAPGIRGIDSDGNKLASRYDALHAGVQARLSLENRVLRVVRAFVGYGVQRFTVEPRTGNIPSPTPDVDYRMVRTGAGTEVALTAQLTLGIDLGWLYLLSVGEIASAAWFPRTKAGGFELGADATYALGARFLARAFIGYQRVFFQFAPQPGDAIIAGGAADTYVTAGIGGGFRL